MIHKPSTVRTFLQLTKLEKVSDKRLKSSQIKRKSLVSFWRQWVMQKSNDKTTQCVQLFFLYNSCLFERVAASMEIITFRSVSPSCVKASKPATTRFWGIYTRITHFAACSHTWKDSLVFFNHCVCTPPMHPLRVLNSVECSAAGRKPCVCECVRWCDISGLTWSDTLPLCAWRRLLGTDTDGGPGSPGNDLTMRTKGNMSNTNCTALPACWKMPFLTI